MSFSIDFNEDIPNSVSTEFYYTFNKIVEGYIYFHIFSIGFISILGFLTIILSNTYPKSVSHGITIASEIIAIFTYLTLKQFFESKKLSQIDDLIKKSFDQTLQEHKSQNIWDQLNFYKNLKYLFGYQSKEKVFSTLKLSIFDKCKISFFWKFYTFTMEQLGKKILLCLLSIIEDSPVDLKAHTEYANSLLDQVEVYQIPKQLLPFFFPSRIKKIENEDTKRKIHHLYHLAVEELKILDNLASKDPWVHAKLADCYKGMQNSTMELKEVETLKLLRPFDKEILFRLGELYFSVKKYSDGIKIYDQLKNQDKNLAIKLMQTYRASQEEYIN